MEPHSSADIPNHRLLIIAGPSGSGKTTLYQSLKAGNHAQLKNRLKLGSILDWKYNHWKTIPIRMKLPAKQIVHYGIPSPLLFRLSQNDFSPVSPGDFAVEPQHSFLAKFDDIAVVSLWIPAALSLARIEEERTAKSSLLITKFRELLGKGRLKRRRYRALLDLCRDERRFNDMFSAWVTYAENLAPRIHLVVDSTQSEFRPVSVASFVGGIGDLGSG